MSAVQKRPSTSSYSSASGSGKLEPPLIFMAMATCHSLTIIDGVLSGDPLDLKVSIFIVVHPIGQILSSCLF